MKRRCLLLASSPAQHLSVLGSRSDGGAAHVLKQGARGAETAAEIIELESRVRRGGYELGEKSLTTLIHAYAKVRAAGKVEHNFNILKGKKRGGPLSPITYNAVLDVHCSTGNLEKARETFNELSKHSAPTVETFTTVMKLHRKLGRRDNALKTYEAMLVAGIQPTPHCLTVYLTCSDDMAQAHAQCSHLSPPYDVYVTTALIGLYIRNDDREAALTAVYKGPHTHPALWTAYLLHFTRHTDIDNFLCAVKLAFSAVTDPDAPLYGVVLRGVKNTLLGISNDRERHSLAVVADTVAMRVKKLPKRSSSWAFGLLFEVFEVLQDLRKARALREYLLSTNVALTTYMTHPLERLEAQEAVRREPNIIVKPKRKTYINLS